MLNLADFRFDRIVPCAMKVFLAHFDFGNLFVTDFFASLIARRRQLKLLPVSERKAYADKLAGKVSDS